MDSQAIRQYALEYLEKGYTKDQIREGLKGYAEKEDVDNVLFQIPDNNAKKSLHKRLLLLFLVFIQFLFQAMFFYFFYDISQESKITTSLVLVGAGIFSLCYVLVLFFLITLRRSGFFFLHILSGLLFCQFVYIFIFNSTSLDFSGILMIGICIAVIIENIFLSHSLKKDIYNDMKTSSDLRKEIEADEKESETEPQETEDSKDTFFEKEISEEDEVERKN
ncbi:hypothetical protein H6501_04410 [Candidatus Woesearchaeota archaeon]|nr:hypothetical protein [Nanoarchaeota archaeon]MCB9370814.1 hypothetical protein [Candidatus Woesearchaeota archaeon]USN43914.1 MAG: hypothetical protein H6500_06010 [Candidatus Woesearchaeota archaeon]